MATAIAGVTFQAAKGQALKIKDTMNKLRNGSPSIKTLSYIAGGLLVTLGFFSFFIDFFTLHVVGAVVQLYMFVFGWAILVIEVRSKLLPAFILKTIRKYFAFITVVWGRGCFFIYVGTLALAEWSTLYIWVGIYLVVLGAGMIYWGLGANSALKGLVNEMKDPIFVESTFNKFDHNGNGMLEIEELGKLLESFGAELNPPQLEAAILLMDKNHDGAISLQEFQAWWDKTEIVNVV
ncbi:unnamed protein product [Ascophyllum nodosum]